MGRRGHGCYWQVPQNSRQVVLLLHGRHRLQQQRGGAKRRSVCVALLLLIRDMCLELGAVVLTGDFNKGAERELPPGGSECERRVSPLEAAFSSVCVPWPTLGVTPLWGPGNELHGNKWPECCGFVILPESQREWLIMKHGSFNVKPAELGLKSSDQTWHYEQWLHLKFAGRKRRRDASPADSNSRRRSLFI